ncbi:MAG: alr0857 family protein [Thermosynechococcaceae cyanobacterium]
MLKLTYTSTGVTLERSCESLEAAIRRRVLLGLRLGEPLGLEPTSVSLLADASLSALKGLMGAIAQTQSPTLRLTPRGGNEVELQLQGYWLAQPEPPGEGIFFMHLDPAIEPHFVNMWQASQQDASCCL